MTKKTNLYYYIPYIIEKRKKSIPFCQKRKKSIPENFRNQRRHWYLKYILLARSPRADVFSLAPRGPPEGRRRQGGVRGVSPRERYTSTTSDVVGCEYVSIFTYTNFSFFTFTYTFSSYPYHIYTIIGIPCIYLYSI